MRWTWVPSAAFVLACHAAGHTEGSPQPDNRRQVPTVLDTPVDFSGSRGAVLDPTQLNEIRIGLFAPTDRDHPVGGPMQMAAQFAVEQLNEAGGFEGVPYRIVTRWDDDPWRGGSKQMIKLVYEDSVWAVIGSVNGDATHIAEQVIAKAWLPLVSPASADPTLTYIRIPWMFRLPPDDKAQAETILREGLLRQSVQRVGLITSTDHDGRVFAEDMLDQLHRAELPPVFHLQLSPREFDALEVARRVGSFEPGALVVRLPSTGLEGLLDHLSAARVDIPVFIPWIPGFEIDRNHGVYTGGIYHIRPFRRDADRAYLSFAAAYLGVYGVDPTPAAAYTYDAVNLIVQSLRVSGLSRPGLRDALAGQQYHGVTGRISWDNAGGNQSKPTLVGRR